MWLFVFKSKESHPLAAEAFGSKEDAWNYLRDCTLGNLPDLLVVVAGDTTQVAVYPTKDFLEVFQEMASPALVGESL